MTFPPPEPGAHRKRDPKTSRDAAERLDVRALETRVRWTLKTFGPPVGPPMCVVEIHARIIETGMTITIDSISPRMAPLVGKGHIILVGDEPRANRTGKTRSQHVYKINSSPNGPTQHPNPKPMAPPLAKIQKLWGTLNRTEREDYLRWVCTRCVRCGHGPTVSGSTCCAPCLADEQA
jgi:hypothetical protein